MADAKERSLPVTLLVGFLGAGKTCLLKHILTNVEGRRVAAIVNDVAALNVDAAIANQTAEASSDDGAHVQLENGCICCDLRESLLSELMSMASRTGIDSVVVEASGVTEPQPLIALLERASAGTGLRVHLDCTVTVVDCSKFMDDIRSAEGVADREDLVAAEGAAASDSRAIAGLLMEQVEYADALILNKTDLIPPEKLEQLEALIRQLNPHCVIHRSVYSRVPLSNILDTGLYESLKPSRTYCTPDRPVYESFSESRAGRSTIASFIYNSRAPFHPGRLHNTVVSWTSSRILRSKGFIWVAGHDTHPLYWSHAGHQLRIQPSSTNSSWSGVRKTEIVVIGIGLNQAAITEHLNSCLMTAAELGPRYAPLLLPTLEEASCCTSMSAASDATDQEVEGEEEKTAPQPSCSKRDVVIDMCPADDEAPSYAIKLPSPSPIQLVEEPWVVTKRYEARIVAKWIKIAFLLAMITILYNVAEGTISIFFATEDEWDEDISLLGFGIDSFIEVLSAIFVLVRLYRHLKSEDELVTKGQVKRWEKQSMAGITVLLILLGVSALAGGIYKLTSDNRTEPTFAGVVIAILSLSGMFFLWYCKTCAAVLLNSAVLEADAACSLGCIHLSWVLLVGSALRKIDSRLWWVDGVAAILIGILIFREGFETYVAMMKDDFDGCGCGDQSTRLVRKLHKKYRTGGGDLKAAVDSACEELANPELTCSGGRPVGSSPVSENVDLYQDKYEVRHPAGEQQTEATATAGSTST